MQVTTLTGETVTLVMPFQFAFEKVAETDFPYFRVYLKGIGKDQWYRVNEFIPGEMPVIERSGAIPECVYSGSAIRVA